MRKHARKDTNQDDIVKAFRNFGFTAHVTSQLGNGFPDLVVGKHGVNYLVEIKDGTKPPSKRALTDDEFEFHWKWRGSIHIVESVDDVLRLAGRGE